MATLGISDNEQEAIARFERDVIQPSVDALVVLQFTADWCGPCKQLSPLLDSVTASYAGKGVRLVRIDVDKERLIAAQFRIQSVPTVYAFYQGQPVADLTNYRSEGQIKQVLDQLLAQLGVGGGEGDAPQQDIAPLIAMGEQVLGEGDAQRAVNIFQQILEIAPDEPDVVGGLARAMIAAGEIDQARALLDSVPDDKRSAAPIARAQAALDLASAQPQGDASELEARLAADPDDHQVRFDLAAARMASGDRDGAADALLEIIARDRDWDDGAARKRLLQLIEAQGIEDPWGRAQRRRLSALLFT